MTRYQLSDTPAGPNQPWTSSPEGIKPAGADYLSPHGTSHTALSPHGAPLRSGSSLRFDPEDTVHRVGRAGHPEEAQTSHQLHSQMLSPHSSVTKGSHSSSEHHPPAVGTFSSEQGHEGEERRGSNKTRFNLFGPRQHGSDPPQPPLSAPAGQVSFDFSSPSPSALSPPLFSPFFSSPREKPPLTRSRSLPPCPSSQGPVRSRTCVGLRQSKPPICFGRHRKRWFFVADEYYGEDVATAKFLFLVRPSKLSSLPLSYLIAHRILISLSLFLAQTFSSSFSPFLPFLSGGRSRSNSAAKPNLDDRDRPRQGSRDVHQYPHLAKKDERKPEFAQERRGLVDGGSSEEEDDDGQGEEDYHGKGFGPEGGRHLPQDSM